MTAPDPLRTVTASATAFEERLAFADDGAGPVIYHATKTHQKLDQSLARLRKVVERTRQKHAEMLHSLFGPEPTEHRDPITWEPLPPEHKCGSILNATSTAAGLRCPHGFEVHAGDTFYVDGQECVLGKPEPVKQPCFTTPIFTAPDLHAAFRAGSDPMAAKVTETLRRMAEQQAPTAPDPDPDRLAARVAHGYEDQEVRS